MPLKGESLIYSDSLAVRKNRKAQRQQQLHQMNRCPNKPRPPYLTRTTYFRNFLVVHISCGLCFWRTPTKTVISRHACEAYMFQFPSLSFHSLTPQWSRSPSLLVTVYPPHLPVSNSADCRGVGSLPKFTICVPVRFGGSNWNMYASQAWREGLQSPAFWNQPLTFMNITSSFSGRDITNWPAMSLSTQQR